LIEAFNKWFQVPEPQLSTIKQIVTMLHTASLMYEEEYQKLNKQERRVSSKVSESIEEERVR
jgi:hypothetical protein